MDRVPAPNGLLLGLAAFATTAVSFVAWLFIALGSIFPWFWGTEWLYTGIALPASLGRLCRSTSPFPPLLLRGTWW